MWLRYFSFFIWRSFYPICIVDSKSSLMTCKSQLKMFLGPTVISYWADLSGLEPLVLWRNNSCLKKMQKMQTYRDFIWGSEQRFENNSSQTHNSLSYFVSVGKAGVTVWRRHTHVISSKRMNDCVHFLSWPEQKSWKVIHLHIQLKFVSFLHDSA